MQKLINKIIKFFKHDLWHILPDNLPWFYRQGVHLIQLITLTSSGFKRSQCTLHAGSLTFFSLMALVPVLALTLVMAKAFGGADLARNQINSYIDGWMTQIEQVAEAKTLEEGNLSQADQQNEQNLSHNFSSQVREIADQLFEQIDQLGFGTLGGIGAVMLLWTVISMLGKVEYSFNRIWGVEKPRPIVRKFADYLAVIMILPFLITAVSTIPVAAIATKFMDQTVGGSMAVAFQTLLQSRMIKTAVPLLAGTLAFAFLLGFMPNTRVKPVPALMGGLITVILFVIWLRLCAMLQIGIAKYSVLYGSFAVLPILLMWVYVSWGIILLGSEIAFALQNRDTYMLEEFAGSASARARFLLALVLCVETARHAKERTGGPFAAENFAAQHGISNRFVKDILEDLVRQGLLAEVYGKPGEYLLCRCGDTLTVADVAHTMLDDGFPLASLGLQEPAASVIKLSSRLDTIMAQELNIPLISI